MPRLFVFAIHLLMITGICVVSNARCFASLNIHITTNADIHDPTPGDGIAGDGSIISLRAAIEETNATSGIDTIFLPGPEIYQLILGPLVLTAKNLVLCGLNLPVIDGAMNPSGSSLLVIAGDSNIVGGVTFSRSGGSAVSITGLANRIGVTGFPNRFLLNCLQQTNGAAIEVLTDAAKTVIENNWIGLSDNGTPYPNQVGIAVRGASQTTIGSTDTTLENRISGNQSYGILITDGALATTVLANRIGLAASGIVPQPNQSDGIRIEYSQQTTLGTANGYGLIVSGNSGSGIAIRDGAADVILKSGHIGADIDGDQPIPNAGDGISINGTVNGFRIDGPQVVIGGNEQNGITVQGPSAQQIVLRRCHIGVSEDGFVPVSNGADGIHLDNCRNVVIGEASATNITTISGNSAYGINMSNGTSGTLVQNSVIGATSNGASSMPNLSGILVSDGCHDNRIGENLTFGNMISGNRGDIFPQGAGIILTGDGCENNRVIGNLIGTDGSGTRALRNGTAGILIMNGASHNVIGGATSDQMNLISGNGGPAYTSGLGCGIHISGFGTSFNAILGNAIGTTLDQNSRIPNLGVGIGIYAGASDNSVGPGNLIAYNSGIGMVIRGEETQRNHLTRNRIVFNDSGSVAIDQQANNSILPPIILVASISAPGTISGELQGLPGWLIELSLIDGNSTVAKTKQSFLGTVTPIGLSSQPFTFSYTATDGDSLLAFVTDSAGNSSAYSIPMMIGAQLDVDDENDNSTVTNLSLSSFPNPAPGEVSISFALPKLTVAEIAVYSILGQRVSQLRESQSMASGRYRIQWDGRDERGERVSAGVYFVQIRTETATMTKKILFIR